MMLLVCRARDPLGLRQGSIAEGLAEVVFRSSVKMDDFRSLLLELSNSLTSSNLKQLKFLCRDVIPDGTAEKITTPLEFFVFVEQLNILTDSYRDFLASKLREIHRNDLCEKLLKKQGKMHSLFNTGLLLLFVASTERTFGSSVTRAV